MGRKDRIAACSTQRLESDQMAQVASLINMETGPDPGAGGGQAGCSQGASLSTGALTETLSSAFWEAGQRVSRSVQVLCKMKVS